MNLKALILFLLLAMASVAQTDTGLKIGPGDLLTVEVYDVPELKQDLRVSDTGDAELALIGKLHLADLTVEAAASRIAGELASHGLVLHAQVNVLVREYATQGVAVSGEVRKPGVFQVLGPRSLAQLISEAGGLTELASPRITIRRHSGGEETVNVPRNSRSDDVLLHPGDTVLVQRAGIAYLVGEVNRSGGYVLQDDGELTIAQLVALGGGMTSTAKGTKAKLVRKTAAGREELKVNVSEILRGRAPDVHLQHDDIVFIPNSLWRAAATRLQNITQMTAGAAIYTSLN